MIHPALFTDDGHVNGKTNYRVPTDRQQKQYKKKKNSKKV